MLLEVVEKVSELSGRLSRLVLFWRNRRIYSRLFVIAGTIALLKDHPDVTLKIKEDFLTGDFKNLGWKTDFCYPAEVFIDDCYAEIHHKLLRNYVQILALNYLKEQTILEGGAIGDASIFFSSEIVGYYDVTRDFDYGDTEKIMKD